jgi:hypothetical protein
MYLNTADHRFDPDYDMNIQHCVGAEVALGWTETVVEREVWSPHLKWAASADRVEFKRLVK